MMTPLERVAQRVMENGNPEDRSVPTPLPTLAEFFDGNDQIGSIGCNLASTPEPARFHDLLNVVRQRPEVSDVRVQITCVDDPGNEWPFSDTVRIMTSASPSGAEAWFSQDLAPDEVWPGWLPGARYEELAVEPGHHPVAAWYD